MITTMINQLWATFGSEEFSSQEYTENFEEQTRAPHGIYRKNPTIKSLVKAGVVEKVGRNQYRLVKEVIYDLS